MRAPTAEEIATLPLAMQMLVREFPPFSAHPTPSGTTVYVVGYGIEKDGHEVLVVITRDPATVPDGDRSRLEAFQICAHHFRLGGSDDCSNKGTRH